MHVLVTADSLSGSWTYARELVTGLVTRGVRVTLVSFGEIPLPDQTAWMDHLHGLDYRPTAFRLEWMQEAEGDLPESSAYLLSLIKELRPDILHLNHFCYGNLPVDVPRVVMAHGDLITRTHAMHDRAPRPALSLNWYRRTVLNGLMGADAVVAPSAWMLDRVSACYARPRRGEVIYPGRNPIFFNPYVSKDDCVLAVGRLVDASKQVFLLTQQQHPLPVCIVGAEHTVPLPRIPIRADVRVAIEETSVAIRGPQTDAQLRALYSRATIYAATSRYEPLGMALALARYSVLLLRISSWPRVSQMLSSTRALLLGRPPLPLVSSFFSDHFRAVLSPPSVTRAGDRSFPLRPRNLAVIPGGSSFTVSVQT